MNNTSMVLSNDTAGEPVNQFQIYTGNQLLQLAAPQILWIDKVVSPIWYVIGFLGNPVSAAIWLSRKVCKTNSSAVYFGSLAIVETIYLMFHVVYELQAAWGYNTYNSQITCELFNFLLITPQYLVPMLVLGFTTERYIAVCHPFVKEKYCTVTRAKIVIGCMAVCSVSLGLVQIYIWSYNDMLGCVFRVGVEDFNHVWTWLTEILLFFIIPVACLIINILVIREIKRLSVQSAAHGQGTTSNNAASTTTLLCVSFYFIFTLLPASIVYAMQQSINQGDPFLPIAEWSKDPAWTGYFTYLTVRKVVEEICLSNYATYFIIYYATGVYFRREFKQKFFFCARWKKEKFNRGNRATISDYSMSATNGKVTCTETVALDSMESPSD